MTPAERARHRMVTALRSAGRLPDPAVEEAFRAVPRHLFLPDLAVTDAYADQAVAVQRVDGVATSSASQPSMMAIMLEQLDVRPGDRVLEIGAGTGYNAALLARIVGSTGSVTAVDIDAELIDSAARHLDAAGVSGVELICGDGALGFAPRAPYDRIVLTVGSADVRGDWVSQLAPEGRLLLPLALRGSQLSVALDLGPDGMLRSDSVRGCAFIRLRGVGAAPDSVLPIGDGVSMQGAEGAGAVEMGSVVSAALTAPGPVLPAGVPLGPHDVWDGFGLWLALHDASAVRLLVGDERDAGDDDPAGRGVGPAAAMFATGTGFVGLGLIGPGPGLALAGPLGGDGWPRPVGVYAFGDRGSVPAQRMLAALAGWNAAGRPLALGLQLLITPGPGPVPVGPLPAAVVALPSATVTAWWPSPVASPAGAAPR